MPRFRPRLTFSLRTLLVLVTGVCIWLGYHLHWIRQRREALAWLDEHHGEWYAAHLHEPADPPLGLRILGEEGVCVIRCDNMVWRSRDQLRAFNQRCEEFRRLFPEAAVVPAE